MEQRSSVYEHGSSSRAARTTVVGRYAMDRTLGVGSTSVVKHARDVETGRQVAIKVLDKDRVLSDNRKSIRRKKKDAIGREISIMKMIRHPNVVRIIEVMATKTRVYIVMELVTGGGELIKKIPQSQTETTGMREGQARSYFQQLICAVDYCHSRGVTHRDLKPANLLVDANGVLKVTDFGMSALPQQVQRDGLLHTACGTLHYTAPEVLRHHGYEGAKADIWSCGVILFFLVAGNLPFSGENINRDTEIRKILRADFNCPPFFSTSLIRLIRRILDPNPATRITMNEIFEDEWFRKDYQPPRFSQDNISFDDDSQNLAAEGDQAGSSAPVAGGMNAFEIFNTYLGYNLIGNLFNQVHVKRETRFISRSPLGEIIAGIDLVAGTLGFEVKKRSNSKMIIEGGANAGRKGHLSIATEIYEMGPPYHMVELRKAGGDALEFHKFCRHITFGLQDIIWRAEPMDIVTETDGAGPSTSTAGASTSTAGHSTSTAT